MQRTDAIQGSNGATIHMDPTDIAVLSGPQNDAAVDNDEMLPLEETPPDLDRTISPDSKTAKWRTETLKIHPNEDDRGSNSATTDNDPHDPAGLLRGRNRYRRPQQDAADSNALCALQEGSPPEFEDMDLQHALQCGVCKLLFHSRSEMNLIRHQNTSGHHCCNECERKIRSCGALLQPLVDSDSSHNFCFECEEDFPSQLALEAHLGSWAHCSFLTYTSHEVVLGIAVFILMLLVAVLMLVLGIAVLVLVLGVLGHVLATCVLLWYR